MTKSGASDIWGKAWRAETFQPGGEKVDGDLYSVNSWWSNVKNSQTQWCPDMGQEVMGTNCTEKLERFITANKICSAKYVINFLLLELKKHC